MKKLYVGNLPFQVDENRLTEIFSSAGFPPSSVALIRDRYSNESRGFGFAEFDDDDAAAKAIEALNGTDIDGRAVVVNEARERSDRGGGFRGGRGGGGGGRGGSGGGRGGSGGGRGGFRGGRGGDRNW